MYAETDRELVEGEHMHFELGAKHYVGRLSQVESIHKRFRGSFLGWYDALPEKGKTFMMWGEALQAPFEGDGPGIEYLNTHAIRMVHTTEIAKVECITGREIVFRTINSLYTLLRY